MADITIDAGASASQARTTNALVFTTAQIGYYFFIDSDSDYKYSKTTDGGQTWGSAVTIKSASVFTAGIWYDGWTSGDSGTIIHTVYIDADADDTFYRSLDTASDTLGTERTVHTGITASATTFSQVSITKARGGNLYCYWQESTSIWDFYRSVDGGTNWTDRARPTTGGFSIVPGCFLYPGNAVDNQDIWAIIIDREGRGEDPEQPDELYIYTYDDSANTWSGSSIVATLSFGGNYDADGIGQWPVAGAVRHSDGNLIFAATTEYDSGTSDFRVWEWDGSTATELTAAASNTDDLYYPGIFIDQVTDDIYLAHLGSRNGSETLGTSVNSYYSLSVDDGATWNTNTQYSASAGDYRQTYVPQCGPRFAIAWRNSSNAILSNFEHSLVFGQTYVFCAIFGDPRTKYGRIMLGFVPEAGATEHNITATGGILAAGTSTPAANYNPAPSGGILSAGTAIISAIYNPAPSGGVLCAGVATIGYVETTSGGVLAAGTATVTGITGITATGGALCAGTATVTTINNLTVSGGVVIAGSATIGYIETGSGGAICAGTATSTYTANILATGGALCSGQAPTVYIETPSGGVLAGGRGFFTYSDVAAGGDLAAGLATVQSIYAEVSSGGILASGIGYQTYNEIGTGGIVISGIGFQTYNEVGTGGGLIEGHGALVFDDIGTGGVLAEGHGGIVIDEVTSGGALSSGHVDEVYYITVPFVSQENISPVYSGGSSNSDPSKSLGGNSSPYPIGNGINNLFDDAVGESAVEGTIDFRAFYVFNDNIRHTLKNAKVWITIDSTVADIAIGLGEINVTSPFTVFENNPPAGIEFSQPRSQDDAIEIGDLAPLDGFCVWVRRTMPPEIGPEIRVDGFSFHMTGSD